MDINEYLREVEMRDDKIWDGGGLLGVRWSEVVRRGNRNEGVGCC